MMRPLPALAAEITAGLRTVRFGRPLYVYERLPSTNDIGRARAEAGMPEGTAVLAVGQTAGRGRRGRSWASPPGGLYLSVVLRPRLPVERWTLIGLAMAVGAASAAEAAAGLPVRVKWPNDLFIEERKVGGILIDTVGAYAVAGIGINAHVPAPQLPAGAISLGVDLVPFAAAVLGELERYYDLLMDGSDEVLRHWKARSATLGRPVVVSGAEDLEGIADDIDPDGALLVRTASGIRRVAAGDVSVRETGIGVM